MIVTVNQSKPGRYLAFESDTMRIETTDSDFPLSLSYSS